jgi:hypothetical protein
MHGRALRFAAVIACAGAWVAAAGLSTASTDSPPPAAGGTVAAQPEPTTTYPELTLKDGRIYRDCRVVRVEPDALLVKHQGGMARLSLFELPEAIQKEHGFDPFAAMEHARAEMERQRELRWKLFWEKQEYESGQARIAEHEAIMREAAREWIPVEATIVQRLGDGVVLARCRRIAFETTKTKSTLGFIVDGPPKRVLVNFGESALALRFAVPVEKAPAVGAVWKGYVHPASEGTLDFKYRGVSQSAAAHLAVPVK